MRRLLKYRFSKVRRGTLEIEVALIFPLVLLIFGALTQFYLLSQNRIYAEQAAYAAARSAMVHKCPPANILTTLTTGQISLASLTCKDDPQRWEDAARWALVAAASSSDDAPKRLQCPDMSAAAAMMGATDLRSELSRAVTNRLCYAYEPENVVVTAEWAPELAKGGPGRDGTVPIRATVRFKYPLTTPIGRFLADGKRSDGTRWRWGEATVTLW